MTFPGQPKRRSPARKRKEAKLRARQRARKEREPLVVSPEQAAEEEARRRLAPLSLARAESLSEAARQRRQRFLEAAERGRLRAEKAKQEEERKKSEAKRHGRRTVKNPKISIDGVPIEPSIAFWQGDPQDQWIASGSLPFSFEASFVSEQEVEEFNLELAKSEAGEKCEATMGQAQCCLVKGHEEGHLWVFDCAPLSYKMEPASLEEAEATFRCKAISAGRQCDCWDGHGGLHDFSVEDETPPVWEPKGMPAEELECWKRWAALPNAPCLASGGPEERRCFLPKGHKGKHRDGSCSWQTAKPKQCSEPGCWKPAMHEGLHEHWP